MSEFIGSRISLISKSDIRYVGTLHQINSQDSTVALEQVKSFGTEGRKGNPDEEQPGSDSVYEYILFRGSDVKDLRIEEAAPKENKPPPMPDDPAILGSGTRPPNQADQRQIPPQQQGFSPDGQSPPFQQRPPSMPYQQYHQFPNQRFPGPQGPPQPGYPGYPGMPYGPPQSGYFPPGQGFQGPPGPFPPQQHMQFPPGPEARVPPQQPPNQQDSQTPGSSGAAEAPAAPLQPPQQSSSTPKPVSHGNTPDPSAPAAQAPPPPLESKPDTAAALGAPPTNQPPAPKAAPTGPKGGKITPVIPLTNPATRAAQTQPSAAQANISSNQGQAAADAAISYQNAAQAASAAVANAMAKLPPAPGQKAKDGGTVDNLAQKVNQMRVDDRIRKQSTGSGGSNTGYRGGRGGGARGRGGREQQNRGIAVPATDFDFESANAQFNKEDLVKEAIATGEPASTEAPSTPTNGDAPSAADGAADVVIPAAASTASVYSKSSFFDNISSEAKDREDGQSGRGKVGGPEFRTEERKRNMETFGMGSVDGGYRGGYRGRGRGRGSRGGGYRGGSRGGFRGGRGAATNSGGVAEA